MRSEFGIELLAINGKMPPTSGLWIASVAPHPDAEPPPLPPPESKGWSRGVVMRGEELAWGPSPAPARDLRAFLEEFWECESYCFSLTCDPQLGTC
jgi:hypothetical protein